MAHIYSDDRLEEKFIQLLDEANERDRVYVYPMECGKIIKPAVYKGRPFRTLESYIRDNCMDPSRGRYGLFYVMIRRGERMLLSGTIAILLPLSQRRA